MDTLLIPIVWSMIAGACLATGVIHLGASLKPRQTAGLAFSAAAFSLMFVAMFELLLMHAASPDEFGEVLRWMHIPLASAVVALVVFVRAYFGTGRAWLGIAACVLRLAALALNFVLDPNIEYREISSLMALNLLWAEVSVPVGVASPWTRIGEASSLLLLVYVADAAIAAWRRGSEIERRRAVLVGGSIVVTLTLAGLNTLLLHAGVFYSIYLYALPFSLVIVALGSETSAGLAGSARLAGQLVVAKSELVETERRLDQAVGAAGIGSWEWDIARDAVWMSAHARALFGVGSDEPLDFERFLSTLHPADREVTRISIDRSLAQGGRFEREYRVVLPEGRSRWIHTRGGVDLDAGARPVLMRGVSWDVTARREAEERFRLVVEAASNGLIMLDPEGRVTLVNARAEAIFGYSREEFRGLDIATLIPEGPWPARAGSWDAAVAEAPARVPAGREVSGRRKDGTEIPLEIGLARIVAPDGLGVLVSVEDISERKRRDGQLKTERAFLRQVIDIAPNLIFAKDREGRFTLANRAVADLYGTTVEGLIGKTDADFNPNAEEVEAFRRDDLRVMDTLQELFLPEEHVTDAQGAHHVVQTMKRPIVDEDGTAQQVLGVATDISARRAAELEVSRQRDELAHLARVTMVSELSGSIAHELNQPLAAILSNAQAGLRFIAQGDSDTAELRAILEDIVADDRRANQVIQGMRLLLRKGEMRRELLDVNEVVREALRLVRSDLLNAAVDVETSLAPGLPRRSADRVQLQQVLLNLIVNACDAVSAAGAARREVLITTALEEDGAVRVCVSDNGVGVPPDAEERIFQPFFTTKPNGLGLGLPICRNIVTALGGRLWVARNAGSGMTFCFTLPERAAG